MRSLILLPVLAFLALAGCRTAGVAWEEIEGAMPASSASVTELREHSDASDAQIRADVVAARTAGEAAYAQAIADGKSEIDARASALAAEIGKAKADAEKAGKVASDAAEDAEGKTPWWAAALGVLGTLVAGWLGLKKFDLGAFIGSFGQKATEKEIVTATRIVLDGGAGAKVPTPPAA